MTFETSDQSDEGTFPDQKMTMIKTNTKTLTKTIYLNNTFKEMWHLKHPIRQRIG